MRKREFKKACLRRRSKITSEGDRKENQELIFQAKISHLMQLLTLVVSKLNFGQSLKLQKPTFDFSPTF